MTYAYATSEMKFHNWNNLVKLIRSSDGVKSTCIFDVISNFINISGKDSHMCLYNPHVIRLTSDQRCTFLSHDISVYLLHPITWT